MKLAGAYINDDTYERLVALAVSNNRTLAGQCRHLFDRALKGDLVVPDGAGLKTTAPAAKRALRAVARALAALETKPSSQPAATAHSHPAADATAPKAGASTTTTAPTAKLPPLTAWEFAAQPGGGAAGQRRVPGAVAEGMPPLALPGFEEAAAPPVAGAAAGSAAARRAPRSPAQAASKAAASPTHALLRTRGTDGRARRSTPTTTYHTPGCATDDASPSPSPSPSHETTATTTPLHLEDPTHDHEAISL